MGYLDFDEKNSYRVPFRSTDLTHPVLRLHSTRDSSYVGCAKLDCLIYKITWGLRSITATDVHT